MKASIIYGIKINSQNRYLLDRIDKLKLLFPQQDFCIDCSTEDFNLGKSKNKGFLQSKESVILLADPDFFTESSFFERIEKFIDAQNKTSIFFSFPVYHANEEISKKIFEETDIHNYDKKLLQFFTKALSCKTKQLCDFIAPYSNVILTSRNIFFYLGGYNENFTGYGSEDFDFMIRAMLALNITPLPSKILEDSYRPASKEFFFLRPYRGFRRLLEAYTFQVESAGFRFIHLYHPKGTTVWHKNRDKQRVALKRELQSVIQSPFLLLDKDWLPHSRKIVCILTDIQRWRLFLTLRCHDFQTVRYTGKLAVQDIDSFCQNRHILAIAFSDDIYSNKYTYDLAENLKKLNYNVKILSNQELDKLGIFPLHIHEESYQSSRLGLGLSKPNLKYKLQKKILFAKRYIKIL